MRRCRCSRLYRMLLVQSPDSHDYRKRLQHDGWLEPDPLQGSNRSLGLRDHLTHRTIWFQIRITSEQAQTFHMGLRQQDSIKGVTMMKRQLFKSKGVSH